MIMSFVLSDVQEAECFTAEGVEERLFSVDERSRKRDAAGGARRIQEAEDRLTLEKASLKFSCSVLANAARGA